MTGFEFGQIQRAFLHELGLALMMGRLVVLWPFCGLELRKTDLTGPIIRGTFLGWAFDLLWAFIEESRRGYWSS